jgi:hypothetical protein
VTGAAPADAGPGPRRRARLGAGTTVAWAGSCELPSVDGQ